MHTRVKAVRKALGLSQREFGEGLGVSRDVIGNIEYGRVPPKELFLVHLCQQYHVNRRWLETGEGEMFAEETPLDKVTEATRIFKRLHPTLQDYALEQGKETPRFYSVYGRLSLTLAGRRLIAWRE